MRQFDCRCPVKNKHSIMAKLNKPAILVVNMLNDFVTGALTCDRARAIVPKRRYSGFFQTDLDILLTELGVKTVVMTGLHTHMCVRHTSAAESKKAG